MTDATAAAGGSGGGGKGIKKTKKESSFADITRKVLSGGCAGAFAKTVTSPFERVKMLSQTGALGGKSGASTAKPSVMQICNTVLQKEGVKGFWAGKKMIIVTKLCMQQQ